MASVQIEVRSKSQGNVSIEHESLKDYSIGEGAMETVKEVLTKAVSMACKAYGIDPKEIVK